MSNGSWVTLEASSLHLEKELERGSQALPLAKYPDSSLCLNTMEILHKKSGYTCIYPVRRITVKPPKKDSKPNSQGNTGSLTVYPVVSTKAYSSGTQTTSVKSSSTTSSMLHQANGHNHNDPMNLSTTSSVVQCVKMASTISSNPNENNNPKKKTPVQGMSSFDSHSYNNALS